MWKFEKHTGQQSSAQEEGLADAAREAVIQDRAMPDSFVDASSPEPVVTTPAPHLEPGELFGPSRERSLRTSQLDGWSTVLANVGQPLRDLFRRGLWACRVKESMDDDLAGSWEPLIAELTRQWRAYQERAREAIARQHDELTEAQQQLGDEVLALLESHVQQQLSALAQLPHSEPLSEEQSQALAELQAVLDERAWRAVEDNTVLRSAEDEAWYRSWEILAAQSPDALRGADGPVSFVQLFSQPGVYRGRLVKVAGVARYGYRVASRQPRYGIAQYYVLWLRPSDGGDSPFAVYLLDLPAGFPSLAERAAGAAGTELHQPVEITGLFFKRWLYASRGGLDLAPLILGKITSWHEPAAEGRQERSPAIGSGALAVLLATTLLVGAGIAFWVYRTSRWSSRALLPETQPPAELPSFDEQSVEPSLGESLGRLQHEDEHER
jgi:hypothetical protein